MLFDGFCYYADACSGAGAGAGPPPPSHPSQCSYSIPDIPTPTPTLIPPLDLALAFVFVSLFFFLHSLQQCQQFIFRDLAAFPFPCAFRSAQVMGPEYPPLLRDLALHRGSLHLHHRLLGLRLLRSLPQQRLEVLNALRAHK